MHEFCGIIGKLIFNANCQRVTFPINDTPPLDDDKTSQYSILSIFHSKVLCLLPTGSFFDFPSASHFLFF